MDDYEQYEKECEQIRQTNAVLLQEFEVELAESGLSKKTIQRHVENVDLLINDYMLREPPMAISDGMCSLDGLFDFFIHKCMWSTPASVKTMAASIKKFIKHVTVTGKMSKDEYAMLTEEIKECLPDWQEDCAKFNGDW